MGVDEQVNVVQNNDRLPSYLFVSRRHQYCRYQHRKKPNCVIRFPMKTALNPFE